MLSARLDGEPADAADDAGTEAHVRACAGCQRWLAAAEDLTRRVRLMAAPEPVPDLVAGVLAAAPERRDHWRDRWRAIGWVRVALAAVAVAQLVLAAESLFGEKTGHAHQLHELGAWDAALAVGFLAAGWRPARAWGMLPLVAAVVLALVVTTGLDMAAGHATFGREIAHLLAVVGLALLRQLAVGGRPALRMVPTT